MDGLIQGECDHDRQEFIGMADSEETWRCMGCAEIILRFIDCGSGA